MNNSELEFQRQLLQKSHRLDIVAPCTIYDGVLQFSASKAMEMKRIATQSKIHFDVFIPASGSGSRMFQVMNRFLNTGIETGEFIFLIENIAKLPFYQLLSEELRTCCTPEEKRKLVEFVIGESGLNYNIIPKGMIPFHVYESSIKSAFQEQLSDFILLKDLGADKIIFSVQEAYSEAILKSIHSIDSAIQLTAQNPEMDSFCFDEKNEIVLEKGVPLRRPAGHGALLQNINEMESQYILIKNIDNVQREENKLESIETWKLLIGVLLDFKEKRKQLLSIQTNGALANLDDEYKLSQNQGLTIEELANRPTRVCGVVKNQGAPGGGPFWVKHERVVRKQIVEKSQINDPDLLLNASHFNPVMMIAHPYDAHGNKLNLFDFVHDDERMRVTKDHNGQMVNYHELPGLWNGSMADWNTIFVEIPSCVFTPVKEVLDLLEKEHQA